MKKRFFVVIVALVFQLSGISHLYSAEGELKPINPKASPEARKVLDYLHSVQNEKMLAGHHVMYGGMKDRDMGYVVETTGKYPALIEFEGGIFAEKFSDDYETTKDQLVKDAIAYWNEGSVIAVCWHWGNPMMPRNTYPNTKIKFDIAAALTEGTPEHAAMMKDLDVTAGLLKELRDANVPVLWRPLHEICGGWFWWGMEGKEKGQELWKFIYTYFTEHHELNNVLWVYSASHDMRTDWFPGLEFADVVGVDIYREGEQDERRSYDKMSAVAGNKPVALSETDIIPDPDVMKERGFLWNWFSTWHSQYIRKNDKDFLKRVYNHDLVITRDELPDFK